MPLTKLKPPLGLSISMAESSFFPDSSQAHFRSSPTSTIAVPDLMSALLRSGVRARDENFLGPDQARIANPSARVGEARHQQPARQRAHRDRLLRRACSASYGIDFTVRESAPTRANLVARMKGRDSSKPALLMSSHVDVVPVEAAQWTRPPFSAEIANGCVWGRGSIDMKPKCAMDLAVMTLAQARRHPARMRPGPRRRRRRGSGLGDGREIPRRALSRPGARGLRTQ